MKTFQTREKPIEKLEKRSNWVHSVTFGLENEIFVVTNLVWILG